MQDHRPQHETGISPISQAASAVLSKCEQAPDPSCGLCENCGKARKFHGRKWCRKCIEAYYESHPSPFGPTDRTRRLPERTDLYDLIPERYHYATVEDLPVALVQRYYDRPDDRGLLLWGGPGVGKTHTISAFLFDLHLNGYQVARTTYEMLCLRIRDTYKAGSEETELGIIKPFIEAEVLAVEDVGTTVSAGAQESDFSLRTFLVLLDQRLEWCQPTFITTNKSVEELGKSFDQRVASRLMQACEIVQLKGGDRRRNKGEP